MGGGSARAMTLKSAPRQGLNLHFGVHGVPHRRKGMSDGAPQKTPPPLQPLYPQPGKAQDSRASQPSLKGTTACLLASTRITMSTNRNVQAKNRAPASIQITAEQILREAKDRQLDVEVKAPRQQITDAEELRVFRMRKRKEVRICVVGNRRWIAAGCGPGGRFVV